MAERFSFGEVNVDVSLGRDKAQYQAEPDAPFRIVILGDFSGRANRGISEAGAGLANRRAVVLDRDNFDQVLAKLGARIDLPLDDHPLSLRFVELDDFHPDRIFERVDIFQKLRGMRQRLDDPETLAEMLREMRLGPAASRATEAAKPPTPRPASADIKHLASGSVLEQVLAETEGLPEGAGPSRVPDELRAFVQRAVEPHLVERADPRQAEMMAVLDRAASAQMRALLHVPDFQALESAWRALFWLVRKVETNERLKLYLLDVSKAELTADLTTAEDLRLTGVYKLLVEKTVGTPGAEPWAVLAGNYTFEPNRDDARLLGRLAKVARAAGAPFLAAASSRVLGCESASEMPNPRDWKPFADSEDARAWAALRHLPEASYVGLALPRFLLRLPYGKSTDRTEFFDFEEMPQTPVHEDYLWGNPVFACAFLLAQAFSDYGWEMRPGVYSEIAGLPLHNYQEDEESQVKPCAEVLLTEDAVEQILDYGPMPLVSLKGCDAVRLVRFQSMAEPPTNLAGHWYCRLAIDD
ncbi:MAG TPA: type VI secretion system contractile sheath large subunit [Terriglobia bacterium]|nr:type VI secretion system contractile sheath large subunit [Terriglobia bacterium]